MRLLSYEELHPEKGIPHSRVHLWRLVRAGKFPAPLKVGSRNCWVESEIDRHIQGLIATRDAAREAADARAAG